MSKFIAILMTVVLLLSACAMAESELLEDWIVQDDEMEETFDDGTSQDTTLVDGDELAGAWTATTLETAKGSAALKAIFDKAVEGLTGVEYTPVILLGTQVVSGMNYCILANCHYTETDTVDTGWCLVYIHEAFGGEVQMTNVVDIDISALSDYGLLR